MRKQARISQASVHPFPVQTNKRKLKLKYEDLQLFDPLTRNQRKFYELYDRMERFHARGINVTLKPQSDPAASAVVDGYTEDMISIMNDTKH